MREMRRLRDVAHQRGLHVAIDGPAASGKSTVGRALARELDCAFLDTGLMYRSVTWLAIRDGVDPSDTGALERLASGIEFQLSHATDAPLLVDGENPGRSLRSADVDALVSRVSAFPGVRSVMVDRQRAMARNRCIVMAGRDIGTVVLPDSPIKLWVTASSAERAQRRFEEGLDRSTNLETIEQALDNRDRHDSGRQASPLLRAPDAVDLVTEGRTPEESLREAVAIVRRKLLLDPNDVAEATG